MAKLAVLTYNTVGHSGEFSNGWHEAGENQVFVASHPRGQRWGAAGSDGSFGSLHESARTCATAVCQTFEQLGDNLDQFDKIMVYVGDRGSEGSVDLVSRVHADKVCFVLCDCNLSAKMQIIRGVGMSASQVELCECGGHGTLERLVRQFLKTGTIARN